MSSILQLGDPRLRMVSAPVAPSDPELPRHLEDLAGALQSFRADHGWGRALSLPQLGIAKRVVVFDIGCGIFFAVNPKVEWLSTETFELWDDCMCMPSIAVRVRRACSLTLSFNDESMRAKHIDQVPPEVSQLIQHELDHLDGVLFTDRMIPKWGVVARNLRESAQPIGARFNGEPNQPRGDWESNE
jgi:peptide deformylase